MMAALPAIRFSTLCKGSFIKSPATASGVAAPGQKKHAPACGRLPLLSGLRSVCRMHSALKSFLPLFLLLPLLLFAQNSSRSYLSHTLEGNTLQIEVTDGSYTIRFYSDQIIETTFNPNRIPASAPSHAVVAAPTPVALKQTETPELLQVQSAEIGIAITKSPLQLSYLHRNLPLVAEKASGFTKTREGYLIDFSINETEKWFGGGARVLGMNRRGNRLQLYNRAHYGYETRAELMNYTMPVAISSKKYLIHFDNPATGWLDLDSAKNNTLRYETLDVRRTYQIVVGNSWEQLISNYTHLTGRQPLPPRWAFGNFASRFGYHSQREAEKTVALYRSQQIPLDAIILDLYWFGKDVKGTMGNLEVYRDSFPKFEKMIADFNRNHIKTIPITEPFILTTSKKWDEAVRENILATDEQGKPFTYDFYFGNTGLIDIFKPSAKNWFWNIYKQLAKMGAAGIWGDLGEPEVHPAELRHVTGTANEVHNIYGHEWAKLIYEGYRRDFPAQRSFILMRAGYSGSQRYGLIPWSGDVNRTWGGLSGQTEIALQMGMQGLAYMHSDLGGFAGANPDSELYTRWLQYGVFQPVFRPHAQEDVPSEPVYRDARTKELAERSIKLRYKLIPYNYTLAFTNSQNGMPLMRPMFFEEPENESLYDIVTQYFWGDNLLVAPVMTAGEKSKTVYLPATSAWVDFHSGKRHKGGQQLEVSVSPENIPVFVREGAFIPMINELQSTAEYYRKQLEIHYYASTSPSKGTLYEDDGESPDAHSAGKHALYQFTATPGQQGIEVKTKVQWGQNFALKKRTANFVAHLTQKPTHVTVNGKKTKFTFEPSTGIMTLPVTFRREKEHQIIIHLR